MNLNHAVGLKIQQYVTVCESILIFKCAESVVFFSLRLRTFSFSFDSSDLDECEIIKGFG